MMEFLDLPFWVMVLYMLKLGGALGLVYVALSIPAGLLLAWVDSW